MDVRRRKAIFRAVFNYFEKYDAMRIIDWQAAADELLEISGQFDQDEFVNNLLAAIYAQLQRGHTL